MFELIREFIRGGALVLAVNIAGAGLAFLSHVLLARLMGVASYGDYVFVLAWVSILTIIAMAGQQSSVVRFVAAYLETGDWGKLAGVIRMSGLVVLGFGMMLSILIAIIVSNYGERFSPQLQNTIYMALVLVPISGLMFHRVSVLQGFGKLVQARLASEITRPVLLMTSVALLAYSGMLSAPNAMAANLTATLVVMALLFVMATRLSPANAGIAPREYLPGQWLAVSGPLFVVGGIQILLTQTDVLMLGWMVGTEQSGLYAPAVRIATLIAFPIIAVRAVIAPKISAFYVKGDREGLQHIFGLSMWSGAVTGLVIGCGVFVLRDYILLLFGESFLAVSAPLGLLIVGQMVVAIVGPVEIFLLMTRHEKLMMGLLAVTTVLNLVLNYMLIPAFGMMGAAVATVITIISVNGFAFVSVSRLHNLRPFKLTLNSDAGELKKRTGKLKITFLLRSLHAGGAERLFCNMAVGLKNRGHEVSVVTFYPGGHFAGELADQGITHLDAGKKSRWDLFGFAWRLRACLAQNDPDVVYSFLPMPNIILGLMKPFVGRAQVVWGSGALNQVSQFHDWLSRLSLWAETRLSGVPDLIIANSVPVKNALISKGVAAGNIVLVANGVNTENFAPDRQRGNGLRSKWGCETPQSVIGRVGRLHPVKGYETFLRASAQVKSPNVKYIIVGDGNQAYTQELKALADELGIANKVHWAGTYKDMTAVYNAFDVTVSSSVEESSPHVAIEAMACGIPSIVTDVGDSSELVNNPSMVVPPGDPKAMARAIDAFVALERSDKAALGEAVRQRMVDHYSEESLITNIENLFTALVAGRSLGAR